MNIELHIERLVLDGLSTEAAQPHLVRGAIERELTRLLAASPPTHAASYATPTLRAPALQPAPAGAAGTGHAIARSVHAALVPSRTR